MKNPTHHEFGSRNLLEIDVINREDSPEECAYALEQVKDQYAKNGLHHTGILHPSVTSFVVAKQEGSIVATAGIASAYPLPSEVEPTFARAIQQLRAKDPDGSIIEATQLSGAEKDSQRVMRKLMMQLCDEFDASGANYVIFTCSESDARRYNRLLEGVEQLETVEEFNGIGKEGVLISVNLPIVVRNLEGSIEKAASAEKQKIQQLFDPNYNTEFAWMMTI